MAQAQNGDGQGQQQQGGGWASSLLSRLITMGLMYYLLVGNPFKQAPTAPVPGQPGTPHMNLMPMGQSLDLWVYMSESNTTVDVKDPKSLIWFEKHLQYDSWEDFNYRTKQIKLNPSEQLLNNGSMYAHIFVAKSGTSQTAFASAMGPGPASGMILYKVHPLTKYAVQTTGSSRRNLVTGESSDKAASELPHGTKKIVSHWKGNLTISLINDRTSYSRGSIPPQFADHIKYDSNGNYYPILWVNEFWLLKENLLALNDTVKELTLDMAFEPLSLFKFAMYSQFSQAMAQQNSMLGLSSGDEEDTGADEFKYMLIDNSPWFLALTFAISMLHMVFDMLAFKNDIQFWRSRKSMEGLSVRSIYINLISEIIIFLYLWDSDKTSWMIMFSAAMGLAIEAWKLTRAVDVSVIRTANGLPWLKFTDKSSYVSKTKVFDEEAMKYLVWLLYPLLIGYSIYSFVYEEHKSIYSWLIGSLAGCVYTFGFIMMTPQLFINYKLKSVAHLPWRTFVYKALNTFIDDLFAFIIRMPTMHRLRVFRDDIIFLVYLYQRWIYPVDMRRVDTPEGEGEAASAEANKDDAKEEPKEGSNDAPKAIEEKKND